MTKEARITNDATAELSACERFCRGRYCTAISNSLHFFRDFRGCISRVCLELCVTPRTLRLKILEQHPRHVTQADPGPSYPCQSVFICGCISPYLSLLCVTPRTPRLKIPTAPATRSSSLHWPRLIRVNLCSSVAKFPAFLRSRTPHSSPRPNSYFVAVAFATSGNSGALMSG